MRRAQEKELRRLEEALLEEEYPQEAFPADSDEMELDWEDYEDYGEYEHYDVYNTDDVDVDMDAYSEAVHQGKHGSGLSVVITMVAMVALSAGILFLLKYLGVL